MKRRIITLTFLFFIFLSACSPNSANNTPIYEREDLVGSSASTTPPPSPNQTETSETNEPSIEPTPTENPFSTFYGCDMTINFVDGPLESKSTDFKVLGMDYFYDKGDKFDPGKGTSVYYQYQHYFILHSSFVNGNILRPMEAEFIRKYLEYWGESGEQYVQEQIDSLIGSEVTWSCNGETLFQTKIDSITRLSHEASQDLWMNPENLNQILVDREGEEDEWIGENQPTTEPYLYTGFCGWGPESAGDERFTYFRYVIRFTIQ
jgi:hypothetical protein